MEDSTRWLWGDHKPRKAKHSQLSLGVERIRSRYFLDFWRKCLSHIVLHRDKNTVTIVLSYQAWWCGMVSAVNRWLQSSMIVLVSSTIQHCLSVAFQFSKPKPGKVWWEDWLGWDVLSRWASHQQSKVLGLWLRRAEGTHDCGHSRRGMFFWKIFSCQRPQTVLGVPWWLWG